MRFDDPELASAYAADLLTRLPVVAPIVPIAPKGVPWRRAIDSGWAALTGPMAGAPEPCPAPLAAVADGALAALAALAPPGALTAFEGAALLGERSAAWGQSRAGLASPGGSCRLYCAADGWLALNLPRPDDHTLLPAWLGRDGIPSPEALAVAIAARSVEELLELGRVLGLAVAPEQAPRPEPPWQIRATPGGRAMRPLRVLDFSGLWAGPLCGQLLRACGADVVKVESLQRPDGARRGPPDFYARLNAGKRCVQLDFTAKADRARLRALVESADLVIEASRPRALRQLGIDAEAWLAAQRGRTWVRLRGYGEEDPDGQWIAFGDDAGVAAGLSWLMAQYGERWLVGDAIGDPLAGLHAALAGWAVAQQGGGWVEVSLVGVLRHALSFSERPGLRDWAAVRRQMTTVPAWPAPRLGVSAGAVHASGADTDAVYRAWGC